MPALGYALDTGHNVRRQMWDGGVLLVAPPPYLLIVADIMSSTVHCCTTFHMTSSGNGGALGIMCSYDAPGGIPACANKGLMVDVLQTEYGLSGSVLNALHTLPPRTPVQHEKSLHTCEDHRCYDVVIDLPHAQMVCSNRTLKATPWMDAC